MNTMLPMFFHANAFVASSLVPFAVRFKVVLRCLAICDATILCLATLMASEAQYTLSGRWQTGTVMWSRIVADSKHAWNGLVVISYD
jgi:hypothetical protein